MADLKPSRKLLKIYGLEDGDGEIHGIMIASQLPDDAVLAVLKQAAEMMEKGMGKHLKDVQIKDPAQIKFHMET